MEDILFTHTIGIFGRRGSGKTTVTMNILGQKRQIPRGIVMCPTPEAIVVYSDQIPLSYIYDYFDEQVIMKIMRFQHAIKLRLHHQYRQEMAQIEANALLDRQNNWTERMRKLQQRQLDEGLSERQMQILYEREIYDEDFEHQQNLAMRKSYARTLKLKLQEPYSMFCVLDDLSSDDDAIKSKVVKKLMDNGRHYMMLLIIAVQYSMDFPAKCRGGLDWIIIFFDTLAPNLKRLFENYVGEFPDRHVFAEALAQAARRECCLVINKRSRSPDVYDSVFLFKPQELWLSTRYFGDTQYEWVHNMFFSDEKYQSVMMGVPPESELQKKNGGGRGKKPPSKSFSIESIERKTRGGGGGGGRGGGRGGGGGRKRLPTQPSDMQLIDGDADDHGGRGAGNGGGGGGGDSDDDYDPEKDRKRKEQLQLKHNVDMLRSGLKALNNPPTQFQHPPRQS